ncbi:MAG: ThuA domain-containing protein [Candidatus Brocadiae bacterium]|nr:ThuA domain-containing protein [Candidatus Brocadiia bacterium]
MIMPCALRVLALTASSALAVQPIPAHRAKQIEDAAPAKPRVAPRQPRKVLLWVTPEHLMPKDPHKGYNIPYAVHAMKALGEKSGAFTPVVSQDVNAYLPENLRQFDAVVFCNASGHWITPSDEAIKTLGKHGDKAAVEKLLRQSLLDWVKGGHGVMAFHFAMGANRHWPEFRGMLGASYWGHPWNEEVAIDVEEPDHPLLAAFGRRKSFRLADEIFQFTDPWSRDKLRVLLSIDTRATNLGVKWIHREDYDFGLAWVRAYGEGRVFYTALGHRTEIFWNPTVLQFYLDGIQFAAGDLEAPTAPRADRPKKWHPGPTPPDVRAVKMEAKGGNVHEPTAAELKKIEAAAPAKAPAAPAEKRKVLVWGHPWTHLPNVTAEQAIAILGRKTGAFEAVVSDDPRLLLGDRLPRFDALVMNNIHERDPFLPDDFGRLNAEQKDAARKFDAAVKQSILDYVKGGKGIVGTHAATAAFQNWAAYGEMMGGYYGAHMVGDVVLKRDDATHPATACFGDEPFRIHEEIYFFRGPHTRKNLRVLLSFDLAQMPDPGKRPDKDYAVSWVRPYGMGRVFYTVLGHKVETHWNPHFLRHLLAGIQFAIGDLPGDAAPLTP